MARRSESQVATAVRQAQGGAAHLRAAWSTAGSAELARRAAREGGLQGTRWRGVGFDAWRQGQQAAAQGLARWMEENPGGTEKQYKAEAAKEGDAGDEAAQRQGWTMAAALIWYKQRQRAARARREESDTGTTRPTVADGGGRGVLVFDIETTNLIEDEVPLEDMEASVACAMWLPHGATAAAVKEDAATATFWHARVERTPSGQEARPMAALLTWMDAARVIVAYNGRGFDMRVLRSLYGGDDARWQAHMDKLMDPMDAVTRTVGRRVRLARLLQLNGAPAKAGTGCDAPRWWQDGRWAQLERYCERDAAGLADLILRDAIRVQPGVTSSDVSVMPILRSDTGAGTSAQHATVGPIRGAGEHTHAHGDKRAREAAADAESDGAAMRSKRRAGGGAEAERAGGATGEHAHAAPGKKRTRADAGMGARDAEGSDADGRRPAQRLNERTMRPNRKRTYDEVVRRPQRPRESAVVARRAYMDRGRCSRVGIKRNAIEMGARALDRVVAQRYQWRDAGLGANGRGWAYG